MGTPQLLTLSEAADRLGLSTRTVSRLVGLGDIASVCIGANRRIKASDLDQYIAGLVRARS
jgi:excisionase family DNA binding protein